MFSQRISFPNSYTEFVPWVDEIRIRIGRRISLGFISEFDWTTSVSIRGPCCKFAMFYKRIQRIVKGPQCMKSCKSIGFISELNEFVIFDGRISNPLNTIGFTSELDEFGAVRSDHPFRWIPLGLQANWEQSGELARRNVWSWNSLNSIGFTSELWGTRARDRLIQKR